VAMRQFPHHSAPRRAAACVPAGDRGIGLKSMSFPHKRGPIASESILSRGRATYRVWCS
jgi:hypothetical protein